MIFMDGLGCKPGYWLDHHTHTAMNKIKHHCNHCQPTSKVALATLNKVLISRYNTTTLYIRISFLKRPEFLGRSFMLSSRFSLARKCWVQILQGLAASAVYVTHWRSVCISNTLKKAAGSCQSICLFSAEVEMHCVSGKRYTQQWCRKQQTIQTMCCRNRNENTWMHFSEYTISSVVWMTAHAHKGWDSNPCSTVP